MINFNNISEYSKSLPLKGGGEKIVGGPLYDLAKVKLIAKDGSAWCCGREIVSVMCASWAGAQMT
jgi:hypothetical protein